MTSEFAPSLVRQIERIDYANHPCYGRIPLHSATNCKLDVILNGEVCMVTEEYKLLRLRGGDAVLVPPLTPHGYEPRRRMLHLAVKFHLHPRYQLLISRRVMRLRMPGHLLAVAHDAGDAWLRADSLSRHLARAAATLCAIHALRQTIQSGITRRATENHDDRLMPLLGRVTDDPLAPWTVRRLADEAHLSESHFNKCFRHAFGQPPQQYLLDTRMIAAADLLRGSTRSIKDVAEAAGYASVHSFTRAFRRVIGQPPAAFRRAQ